MRVAISGSPVSASRTALRSFTASMTSFCRRRRQPAGARQVQDRLAGAAERHALVRRRQEAAAVQRGAAARAARAGLQHDEAGQILGGRCPGRTSPTRPCSAGPPAALPVFMNIFAGAWLNTLVVIVRTTAISSTILAVYGRHSDTQVPALPCCANLRRLPRMQRHLLGEGVHEGEALALEELVGAGLAVQAVELGLVVEQLQLAGAAGHEQVDDALGLRLEVRLLRRERPLGEVERRGGAVRVVPKAGQRQRAEAEAALAEEVSSRLVEQGVNVHGGVSRSLGRRGRIVLSQARP